MSRRELPLRIEALRQQDPFHDVQLPVRPGLDVAGQIIAHQPVVQVRLVLLVPQVRLDDLPEEVRVAAEQEEVQLVAGVLGVELALLLVLQRRPLHDEAELPQRRIAAQRHVQRVDLGEAVVGFLLRTRDVGQHQRLALAEDADLLLLGEVLLGVQRLRQAEFSRLHVDFRQRNLPEDRVLGIDREHVHVMVRAHVGERNRHDPVGIGRQVDQHGGGIAEEVQVGQVVRLDLAAGAREPASRRAARLAAVAAPESAAFAGALLARIRLADGPGVQQQPRTLQHVARELRRVLAFEDVAVLIADLPPGHVDRQRPPQQPHAGLDVARHHPVVQRVGGQVPRSHHVHAGELRGVLQADGDVVLVGRHRLDLQRAGVADLQPSLDVHHVGALLLARSQLDVDRRVAPLDQQRVIAGRQVLDHDEAVADLQGVEAVLPERSAAEFQQ